MDRIKQLRQERAKLIAQARNILDAAEEAGREMTSEEDAEFARLHDAADKLKAEIDTLEQQEQAAAARATRQEQAERELEQLQAHGIDLSRVAGTAAPAQPGDRGGRQGPTDEDYALAVQGWFLSQTLDTLGEEPTEAHREAAARCGIRLEARYLQLNLHRDYGAVRAQIQNALKSNVPASGGAVRLGQVLGPLEQAMLTFGPMMQVSQVIRTENANPLPWPTANDTSNSGRQIGESKAVSELDPEFAALIWGAYKFTSDEVLVPFELMRDSPFNLAQILGEMLGERLGRVINTKATVGTGAATMHGIVPRSTLGKEAAATNAIVADELIDLQHSVPRAYRSGAGFMAHDSIWQSVRKLKDGNGQYLWQPSLMAGQPETLANWPTQTNDDMAQIAASAKVIVAGQFSTYKIRQVGTIRLYRLTERHRENDQDAFLAFTEADGNLLDPGVGPVRHLKMADS